jgi:hypothetical protein
VVGAGEKLPAVQVHFLILGAAGTAADGHITQVCPHQSGFEIVSGSPVYSGYPANGRPPRRRDHTSPGIRCRTGMFPGVPRSRLGRRGLPPSGSQHQDGCLHVVEYNGHGISPSAEEASSPYGATDRGRPSCPNQASHGSIRYASATRVRSNAPGRCSNCLKQRPTRLREYPSCHYSRYIRPYRTSIDADLFPKCLWALRDSSTSVWRRVTAARIDGTLSRSAKSNATLASAPFPELPGCEGEESSDPGNGARRCRDGRMDGCIPPTSLRIGGAATCTRRSAGAAGRRRGFGLSRS